MKKRADFAKYSIKTEIDMSDVNMKDNRSRYNEEIEKAEKKISDGEKTLKELKDPDTYVLGRSKKQAYSRARKT